MTVESTETHCVPIAKTVVTLMSRMNIEEDDERGNAVEFDWL